MESGRASSPPKVAIWGRAEWEGKRGGCLGSMVASRCLRRASSWASCFCFLLILPREVLRLVLLPRISEELFPLVRRKKLKLDLRGPACSEDWDWATDGRTEGSGEPSLWAEVLGGLEDRSSMVVAMVGGGRALNISGCYFARV
jgi:hypothetical protein